MGLIWYQNQVLEADMNFPDIWLFRTLYWFINTPGIGGIIVVLLAVTILTAITFSLRWIINGGKTESQEVYSYPTEALHREN